MELRQERISTLREVLRRAEREPTDASQEDYRRKPELGVDAQSEDGVARAREDVRAESSPNDWSGTLDLVVRAGEKLVVSEERVRELESEVRDLTETASLEIQQLRAQVADLQRHLHDAEAARRHAEDWLRRLTNAVRERFSPEARQDTQPTAAQAS